MLGSPLLARRRVSHSELLPEDSAPEDSASEDRRSETLEDSEGEKARAVKGGRQTDRDVISNGNNSGTRDPFNQSFVASVGDNGDDGDDGDDGGKDRFKRKVDRRHEEEEARESPRTIEERCRALMADEDEEFVGREPIEHFRDVVNSLIVMSAGKEGGSGGGKAARGEACVNGQLAEYLARYLMVRDAARHQGRHQDQDPNAKTSPQVRRDAQAREDQARAERAMREIEALEAEVGNLTGSIRALTDRRQLTEKELAARDQAIAALRQKNADLERQIADSVREALRRADAESALRVDLAEVERLRRVDVPAESAIEPTPEAVDVSSGLSEKESRMKEWALSLFAVSHSFMCQAVGEGQKGWRLESEIMDALLARDLSVFSASHSAPHSGLQQPLTSVGGWTRGHELAASTAPLNGCEDGNFMGIERQGNGERKGGEMEMTSGGSVSAGQALLHSKFTPLLLGARLHNFDFLAAPLKDNPEGFLTALTSVRDVRGNSLFHILLFPPWKPRTGTELAGDDFGPFSGSFLSFLKQIMDARTHCESPIPDDSSFRSQGMQERSLRFLFDICSHRNVAGTSVFRALSYHPQAKPLRTGVLRMVTQCIEAVFVPPSAIVERREILWTVERAKHSLPVWNELPPDPPDPLLKLRSSPAFPKAGGAINLTADAETSDSLETLNRRDLENTLGDGSMSSAKSRQRIDDEMWLTDFQGSAENAPKFAAIDEVLRANFDCDLITIFTTADLQPPIENEERYWLHSSVLEKDYLSADFSRLNVETILPAPAILGTSSKAALKSDRGLDTRNPGALVDPGSSSKRGSSANPKKSKKHALSPLSFPLGLPSSPAMLLNYFKAKQTRIHAPFDYARLLEQKSLAARWPSQRSSARTLFSSPCALILTKRVSGVDDFDAAVPTGSKHDASQTIERRHGLVMLANLLLTIILSPEAADEVETDGQDPSSVPSLPSSASQPHSAQLSQQPPLQTPSFTARLQSHSSAKTPSPFGQDPTNKLNAELPRKSATWRSFQASIFDIECLYILSRTESGLVIRWRTARPDLYVEIPFRERFVACLAQQCGLISAAPLRADVSLPLFLLKDAERRPFAFLAVTRNWTLTFLGETLYVLLPPSMPTILQRLSRPSITTLGILNYRIDTHTDQTQSTYSEERDTEPRTGVQIGIVATGLCIFHKNIRILEIFDTPLSRKETHRLQVYSAAINSPIVGRSRVGTVAGSKNVDPTTEAAPASGPIVATENNSDVGGKSKPAGAEFLRSISSWLRTSLAEESIVESSSSSPSAEKRGRGGHKTSVKSDRDNGCSDRRQGGEREGYELVVKGSKPDASAVVLTLLFADPAERLLWQTTMLFAFQKAEKC